MHTMIYVAQVDLRNFSKVLIFQELRALIHDEHLRTERLSANLDVPCCFWFYLLKIVAFLGGKRGLKIDIESIFQTIVFAC